MRNPVDRLLPPVDQLGPHFDPAAELDEPDLLDDGSSTTSNFSSLSHYTLYSSVPLKWVVVMIVVSILCAGLCSIAFIFNIWSKALPQERASIYLAFFPLLALLIMFGFPPLRDHFCVWLNHLPFSKRKLIVLPLLLTTTYLLASLVMLKFNPLIMGFVFSVALLVTGTLQEVRDIDGFMWTDLSMWCLVWFPLKLKWGIWGKFAWDHLDNMWWSLAMSLVVIVGWGCLRPSIGIPFKWRPVLRDGIVFSIVVAIITLATLPIAFLTDLVQKPKQWNVGNVFFVWVQEFLAVSIPEELIFRAVVLNVLAKITKREYATLLLASLLYSVIFWPGELEEIVYQVYFMLYGFVTGMVFGASFLRSGQILPGALAHSLLNLFVIMFIPLPSS